jgi:cytochrome c553
MRISLSLSSRNGGAVVNDGTCLKLSQQSPRYPSLLPSCLTCHQLVEVRNVKILSTLLILTVKYVEFSLVMA